MSQILSTPLANQLAILIANTFSDGFLDFYDLDPNAGGILLAECKLPMAPFSASNGILSLAGQWFGTASVPGITTFARFRDTTGTNYLIVTVGTTNSKQIVLTNTTLIVGNVISITSFTYTVPIV